jgi:integrase
MNRAQTHAAAEPARVMSLGGRAQIVRISKPRPPAAAPSPAAVQAPAEGQPTAPHPENATAPAAAGGMHSAQTLPEPPADERYARHITWRDDQTPKAAEPEPPPTPEEETGPAVPEPPEPGFPRYRRHATGQARVTYDGRDIYLGPYGSPESFEAYRRVHAELRLGFTVDRLTLGHARANRKDGAPVTVHDVLEGFRADHAKRVGYSAANEQRHASMFAGDIYGSIRATDFRPPQLLTVRDCMLRQGLSRRIINRRVKAVVKAFRWAAARMMIPAETWAALSAVPNLRAGETEAREPKRVQPADERSVRAVIDSLPPALGAMLELQMITGMRSGELCRLTPAMIDRSGPVWKYSDPLHKTRKYGVERVIALGPRAQALLSPWMDGPADAAVFSPAKTYPWLHNGNKARKTAWNVNGYGIAVAKAVARVRRGDPTIRPFHPHQLRHLFATNVRERFGLDAAQAALGHLNLAATQIYAKVRADVSAKVAGEIG